MAHLKVVSKKKGSTWEHNNIYYNNWEHGISIEMNQVTRRIQLNTPEETHIYETLLLRGRISSKWGKIETVE